MMSEFENSLNQRFTETPVASWGVRFSSSKVFVQCQSDWFTREQVVHTLHHLAHAANGLTQYRIDPIRLCWVFDRVRIFFAIRPDDVCLGVMAANRPGQTFDAVESALEEFLALPQI
jgi:hypothetical protein